MHRTQTASPGCYISFVFMGGYPECGLDCGPAQVHGRHQTPFFLVPPAPSTILGSSARFSLVGVGSSEGAPAEQLLDVAAEDRAHPTPASVSLSDLGPAGCLDSSSGPPSCRTPEAQKGGYRVMASLDSYSGETEVPGP